MDNKVNTPYASAEGKTSRKAGPTRAGAKNPSHDSKAKASAIKDVERDIKQNRDKERQRKRLTGSDPIPSNPNKKALANPMDKFDCHRCGNKGHLKRDCPAPACKTCAGFHKDGICNTVCFKCDAVGHSRKFCPKKKLPTCFRCHKVGHNKKSCKEVLSDVVEKKGVKKIWVRKLEEEAAAELSFYDTLLMSNPADITQEDIDKLNSTQAANIYALCARAGCNNLGRTTVIKDVPSSTPGSPVRAQVTVMPDIDRKAIVVTYPECKVKVDDPLPPAKQDKRRPEITAEVLMSKRAGSDKGKGKEKVKDSCFKDKHCCDRMSMYEAENFEYIMYVPDVGHFITQQGVWEVLPDSEVNDKIGPVLYYARQWHKEDEVGEILFDDFLKLFDRAKVKASTDKSKGFEEEIGAMAKQRRRVIEIVQDFDKMNAPIVLPAPPAPVCLHNPASDDVPLPPVPSECMSFDPNLAILWMQPNEEVDEEADVERITGYNRATYFEPTSNTLIEPWGPMRTQKVAVATVGKTPGFFGDPITCQIEPVTNLYNASVAQSNYSIFQNYNDEAKARRKTLNSLDLLRKDYLAGDIRKEDYLRSKKVLLNLYNELQMTGKPDAEFVLADVSNLIKPMETRDTTLRGMSVYRLIDFMFPEVHDKWILSLKLFKRNFTDDRVKKDKDVDLEETGMFIGRLCLCSGKEGSVAYEERPLGLLPKGFLPTDRAGRLRDLTLSESMVQLLANRLTQLSSFGEFVAKAKRILSNKPGLTDDVNSYLYSGSSVFLDTFWCSCLLSHPERVSDLFFKTVRDFRLSTPTAVCT